MIDGTLHLGHRLPPKYGVSVVVSGPVCVAYFPLPASILNVPAPEPNPYPLGPRFLP